MFAGLLLEIFSNKPILASGQKACCDWSDSMRDYVNLLKKPSGRWSAFYLSLFLLSGCMIAASGQYYGMQFKGHEYSLDQRSGLDLTPNRAIEIKGNLDLEFYLRFEPGQATYFGYIFRMLIGDQNIDLIHGVVPRNPNNFELIIGDRTSKIAFSVPIDTLSTEWLHLQFRLNFTEGTITAIIQGHEMTDTLYGIDRKSGLRLMFGAHSIGHFSSTDVPSMMIIRDVKLTMNDKVTYHWPLDETDGTVAHSSPAVSNGIATNPIWLLKQHNTWEKVLDLQEGPVVKTAFDPGLESLFIVFADSVLQYQVPRDSMITIHHRSPLTVVPSSDLIYDTVSDRLWLYSIDNNYLASFDEETGEWSDFIPGTEPLTSYWHHNRVFTSDGTLMVFGGYGYHTYKNSVFRWNPEGNRFDSVNYKGSFDPRYLAGGGINPSDGDFYLIGGYGSESGKQSESPDYYYDVLRYDFSDSTFSTVNEFTGMDHGFCFSNSVIFDDQNDLYGLYFSKYDFENHLQLVRISLESEEIVEVGNPIPYRFLDVDSYTDLYYCRSMNTLLALTSYVTEEGSSVSLYSIAFPPQSNILATGEAKFEKYQIPLYIVLGAGVLIFLAVLFFRRKKADPEQVARPVDRPTEQKLNRKENSILLFGGFQVFDKVGNDITGQFTPLPKKLFLYILLHSLRNDKGVSSNSLYETFWFDKSVESARNNRAVNIVKLKSLLEKMDSSSISKETGYWKFEFDPAQMYIDYFEFLSIVHQKDKLKREDMVRLLSIVENSPFLNNTNAEWLDSFKSDVSNEIIDTFLKYISHSSDDPEFLLHLTNCIFVFDMVSEEALKLQCKLLIKQGKHSLAKSAYNKFIKEFRQLYDEDYRLSFNQVIED